MPFSVLDTWSVSNKCSFPFSFPFCIIGIIYPAVIDPVWCKYSMRQFLKFFCEKISSFVSCTKTIFNSYCKT